VTPGNVSPRYSTPTGTTPIGHERAGERRGALAVFAFDIKPTLNAGSNGVLPSSSSARRAWTQPESIRHRCVSRAWRRCRWSLEPRGTLNDLTLKFDRQSVVAGLQQRLAAGPVAVTSIATSRSPSPAQFASALMGGDALTASQVKAADRNGNGTIDIGDLRALVRNASASVAPADISLALSGPGSGGGGLALGPSAPSASVILVITGTMRDGTPLMGENAITIKGMGQ